jgi:hypothetical protein
VKLLADNPLKDSPPVSSDLIMLDGSTLQSSHTSQDSSPEKPLGDSATSEQKASMRSSSLRSLQKLLASDRSSNYLEKVASVMRYSSSNSWRSSLTSLSSVASSAQQARISHSLTVQEAEIWDEIIDDRKLVISQGDRPKYRTASLRSRTCCMTQENPVGSATTCQCCGLTLDHRRSLQVSTRPSQRLQNPCPS